MNRNTLLAHHWADRFRGGEAVLEQFSLLFPEAKILTLHCNPDSLGPILSKCQYSQSMVHGRALLEKHFRKLLPLFPLFIATIQAPEAELLLSSDAALIKGVRLPENCLHVCYCHSPPRYLWGLEDSYFASKSWSNSMSRMLLKVFTPYLRRYDRSKAQRVDYFIANSKCVQSRIKQCYDRDSVVIHPPVEVDRFQFDLPREDFYLVVSALVPYKRIDIAIEACTRLRKRLVVIGTGPQEGLLKKKAGETVQFLGWQSNEVVRKHMETCKAFLFPGIEDFGIAPCEAQAAGAPIIAFGEGGVLETVDPGVTGLFFQQQTVEGLCDCISKFEGMGGLNSAACRANVERFTPSRFRNEIRTFLRSLSEQHRFELSSTTN